MPEDLVIVFALCVGVSDTELETMSVVIYFPNPVITCRVDFLLSYQRWCVGTNNRGVTACGPSNLLHEVFFTASPTPC